MCKVSTCPSKRDSAVSGTKKQSKKGSSRHRYNVEVSVGSQLFSRNTFLAKTPWSYKGPAIRENKWWKKIKRKKCTKKKPASPTVETPRPLCHALPAVYLFRRAILFKVFFWEILPWQVVRQELDVTPTRKCRTPHPGGSNLDNSNSDNSNSR